MATTDFCDGDYLGAYRRFLEHFVANVCKNDQLPVKTGRRDVRDCEVAGEIADIALQHLNQRICPPSLQAYLVKLVIDEFKILFQKQPEECGYRPQEKIFSPLKLMQAVTNKVNEICQRYLDNSRLALLPPPPSTPLPLASSCAIKNRRRKMEDRSVVLHDLHTMFSIKNEAVVNYYAVFDGHAGQEAATYCAAHLHQYLVESPYYPMDPELALRDAFRTTDYRFIENDETKNSGATAVCALLYDKTLYIAWAGDSQAALIKNGRGINLTIPHKPERPDEKKRINSLGGEVIYFGSWRVNGVLNVSRSLGDAKYKPYVSGEPEIKKIELDGSEDFLIVACDGFWERTTEDIAASLLYEYVGSSHCENSASESLVFWAKQNLSEDNISVIVVFLTPPDEIAAKSFFDPRPVQSAPSMEPGYQQQQEQPYELDFGFGKQLPQQPHQQANGNDDGYAAACANSLLEPINGRHRPKPPRYNNDDDDDDDDDDEEDEEEDVDLGPETNVDAVDDVPEEFGKLDQAMGQNYPDEFLLNMHSKRQDDDFPMDAKKRHQNDLIPEADNVADSEDSEDEWNYYRPDDNKSGVEAVNSGPRKDPDWILIEKPDKCEEEKEPCSPKPSEDNNFDNQPVSSSAEVEADADTDDVTAEYDEIHEAKEREQAQQLLKDTDTEAEATIPEEDFPFDKDQQQHVTEEHLQFEQPQLEHQPQLEQPQFEDSKFDQPVIEQQSEFEQQTLEQQSEFEQLEFKKSEVEQPQLEQSQFDQPEFEKPLVEQSQFEEPQFEKAHLEQPEFEQPQFEQTHLEQAEFEQPQLEQARLEQPEVEEPQLAQTHLEQPEFEQSQIEQTHLEQPEFDQPHLEQSEFEQPHFEQTPLEQPELEQPEIKQQPLFEQSEFEQPQIEQEPLFEQRELEQKSDFEQTEAQFDQVQPERQEVEHIHIEQSQDESELNQHEKHEEEDMESHLNPDAAEFVPHSSTSPLIPQIMSDMNNDVVAGSPLKQSQRALKNRKIPSEEEFQKEICHRPSEIDDSTISEFSNGEPSPQKNSFGICNDEKQWGTINTMNLDESEISSTKAEFGDESTANYSVASEFYKTGLSTIDCSYSESERSEYDFSKDAMATSMTPGDFKNAFEQEPDLNKVHDLSDDDIISDVQNGSLAEKDESMIVNEEELSKEKIDLDLENFIPQQEQNAAVFSSIVEQKESDNKDMFMNMRNSEHFEHEDKKDEREIIDTSKNDIEIASPENEKIAFSSDDLPTYASNNPFSSDYIPASESETNIDNLTENVQNLTLEESKQELSNENNTLSCSIPQENQFESITEKDIHEDVMEKDIHKDMLEKDVEDYVMEKDTHEDIMEKDIHEDVMEKDIHEDIMEKDIHEDIMEKDIHEDVMEKDIHEDVIKKDVNEDVIEKGIHEDVMEKDIQETTVEKQSYNDIMANDIHKEMMEEEIHANAMETDVYEDITKKSIHEDEVQNDIHEDMMEKDVQEDIHEDVMEKDIYKDEMEKDTNVVVEEKALAEDVIEKNIQNDIMQQSTYNNIMQNPLNLSFMNSDMQKSDEPVLVSPIVEPETMSSKFAEENLMSESIEALHQESSIKPDESESFLNTNHVEILNPLTTQENENSFNASPAEEVHESVVETLERKSINLSESLQEFTGLEEQLSPKHNEVEDNVCAKEDQTLKENLVEEQKDVEEVATAPICDIKVEETPDLTNETPKNTEAPIAAEAAVAAAAAATVVAAAAATAATKATKTTKSATAVPKGSKLTATSKLGAKSTTPTSPTKTGTAPKTGTAAATKKPTSTTPRPKAATSTTAKTAATNSVSKTTAATKLASAPKTTTTAAKTTTRTTTSAAPKPKPLSSVTSKISSTSTDKKPMANGDVKSTLKSTSAPKTAPKAPTSTSAASKTGLVKTSTTSRTTTSATTTTTASKTRPTSSTTTKPATSRLSTANVTNATNKPATGKTSTAPTSTTNTTAKSKVGTTAKSPMIDKQIKETANKQISSARSTTATAPKSRLSLGSSTTTTTAKRTSLVQKQSTSANSSPTKKPAPITKPGSKTNATGKVNSKVTSTTKTTVTSASTKVVQNGICETEETKINTTTTATTNIEEDIPKKDISPIEPVTDNQLITAE